MRKRKRKGRGINANVTNEEWATEENDYDPEINEIENGFSEEQWDVNFTASGDGPSSDLGWGEIVNFGTGSEAEQFCKK